MKVHPGAYAAAAAAVVAYLAVGVPASGAGGAEGATPPGVGPLQCPQDASKTVESQLPAAAASVEATVPRMTFVTSTRTGWVVRTNTGAQPNPRDQFVVLTAGGSSTATATLERLVLAACG